MKEDQIKFGTKDPNLKLESFYYSINFILLWPWVKFKLQFKMNMTYKWQLINGKMLKGSLMGSIVKE